MIGASCPSRHAIPTVEGARREKRLWHPLDLEQWRPTGGPAGRYPWQQGKLLPRPTRGAWGGWGAIHPVLSENYDPYSTRGRVGKRSPGSPPGVGCRGYCGKGTRSADQSIHPGCSRLIPQATPAGSARPRSLLRRELAFRRRGRLAYCMSCRRRVRLSSSTSPRLAVSASGTLGPFASTRRAPPLFLGCAGQPGRRTGR
jgi:hypothetical protein